MTAWSFAQTLEAYQVWNARYSTLGVKTLFVLRDRFQILKSRASTEDWLNTNRITQPVAFDQNGSLAESFGSAELPRLVILENGELVHNHAGADWLKDAEVSLGKILRKESPGLPLLRPWVGESLHPVDRTYHSTTLGGELHELDGLEFVGRWHVEPTLVWTQDSDAKLHFRSPTSDLAIVAESMTEVRQPTVIRMSGVSSAISEDCAGEDAVVDALGNLHISVQRPRSFVVLKNLAPSNRELIFSFPDARETPVGIHGFEFAQSAQIPS
ncbi:MAG: hypothetical protein EOP09_01425 [Proteobacteria bacterium]|nr:MAG: hypothetical protein EOP09_01425 [Pseudomonadota bacterium]